MAGKKTMRDGWHVISGHRVLVEDGRVMRGIVGDGDKQTAAWPYRWSKRSGCWTSCDGLTVDAFRAGARRDTIIMA